MPVRGRRRSAEVATCSKCGELIAKVGHDDWRHVEMRPEECRVQVLDAEQAAGVAGLTTNTFQNYRFSGRAPEPDGRLGRKPYWWRTTIEHWMGNGR
jgi:hypothetical protein